MLKMLWVILLGCLGVFVTNAQNAAPVARVFEVTVPLSSNGSLMGTVMWSPRGDYLANSAWTGEVDHTPVHTWNIFDAANGELLYSDIDFIAWYADDSHVLMTDDRGFLVSLNLKTGQLNFIYDGPFSLVNNSIFIPVYDHVAIGTLAGNVRVFDIYTGAHLATIFEGEYGKPFYSADRSQLAAAGEDMIDIYDTSTWTLIASIRGYTLGWRDIQWSADNRHLVVVSGSHRGPFFPRFMWTVGEGISAPLFNFDSTIWWSPDGLLIAEANNTELRFFDSATGDRMFTVRGLPYGTGIGTVLFGNDRYIVTAHGSYGTAFYFVAVTDWRAKQIVFEDASSMAVATLWDDRLYLHEHGKDFRVYDLTGEAAPVRLEVPNPHARLSPDGRWLASYEWPQPISDPTLNILYRISTSPQQYSFEAGITGHLELAWSPDGRRFALYGGESNTLSVWELTN